MKIKTGQIYIHNDTKKVYAILYNPNSDKWDFTLLANSDILEELFNVGGNWESANLKRALSQYYTLIGHLEELDIESYLAEKDIKTK